MINPVLFIKLSEGDKRLIFVIFLALLIILIIVGAIGYLITKVMKYQASKLETAVYDVVVTKVITDEKAFKKYAWKKNVQILLRQTWKPIAVIAFGFIILLIRAIIYNNWGYNPWNYTDGFGSLFWVWDWENAPTATVFGITVISEWPRALNEPRLVGDAWAAYISVPCFLVGGVWYILVVQGFFARLLKTKSLAHSVFKKSLENYNQARGFTDGGPQINPNAGQQTQPAPAPQPSNPFPPSDGGNGFPPTNPM